jgi:DNA gyrase subunit A
VEHRHEVLVRKTTFELNEAEKKAHILEGLIKALDHLDEVIALIRASRTPEDARTGLIEQFELSEIQARAILEMRLQKLTGLEQEKLKEEYAEIMKIIEHLKEILASESMRMQIIKDELTEIKEKYGDDTRTEIEYTAKDFSITDTIPDEEVAITISHMGYIKRTALTEYRRQHRGGIGAKGSEKRGEDFLEHLYIATNHNYMLFFTEKGKCYWLRVFEIPEGTKTSKGRAIQNLINLERGDKVRAFINVKDLTDKEYVDNNYIILCTQKGTIKKTSLEAYSRPRQNGIIAVKVREGDTLLEARLTNGENEIILALKSGRAIRFNEQRVRPMGRNASGVRGIRLGSAKDEVVGMICLENGSQDILVVSENGYGKKSKLDDYRITNRGGKGVKTINITPKTGDLIAIKAVTDNDDLMIINQSGVLIRMAVTDMRVMGRATQGVRLINIREGDAIASVARVEIDDEAEETATVTDENSAVEATDKDVKAVSDENPPAEETDEKESSDDKTEL